MQATPTGEFVQDSLQVVFNQPRRLKIPHVKTVEIDFDLHDVIRHWY